MPSSPASDPGEQSPMEAEASLEAARGELAEMEDRFKRARADLENYRKRADRDFERRVAERHDAVLREWLEVVDSVERAMIATPDTQVADGLRAVRDQIEGILARQGVTRLGRPGEPFDPERHEAVGVRPSEEHPDGTIVEVVRSGYAAGDRVLRPAQVIVARSAGAGG